MANDMEALIGRIFVRLQEMSAIFMYVNERLRLRLRAHQ